MRLFAAATALVLFAGIALAAEHTGRVTKVSEDGKKITLKYTDGDKEVEKEFTVASGATISVKTGGKGGAGKTIDTIEGLRTALTSSKRGGAGAKITTNDKGEVTKIESAGKRRKKDAE